MDKQHCQNCTWYHPLPEEDHPHYFDDEGVCMNQGEPCYGDLVSCCDWCPHWNRRQEISTGSEVLG